MSEDIKKFKLREEKHVMTELEHMEWSPSMDLLAFANKNGEVIVNRLSWQRVWSLPPPTDGDKVGGLAWRPDGKVIAVGYISGTIRICDVEKGDQVFKSRVKGTVTHIVWLDQAKALSEGEAKYAEDVSDKYLPSAKQQSLYSDQTKDSDLEAYERFRDLTSQKELNLLLVGTDASQVSIFSYGAFLTAVVDLNADDMAESIVVENALISPDLSMLSVIVRSTVEGFVEYKVKSFSTNLLLSRHEEIRVLASKYVMVASAQMELQVIIDKMCEAWEDILREMDSRLMKFTESKRKLGGSSVGNDFLQLLLFGVTSLELQTFLLQELTDKGLKKLGFSIENSYSNIQKLVVRQLQRVSHNMTSHLSDLHGMAQWYDRFAVLGLKPDLVHDAVKTSGAFAVSGSELQQVIDTSMKNFKAFFRWLYIAIMRLSNEQLPPDLAKMTQHDINFVAEFLRDNFGEIEKVHEREREADVCAALLHMSGAPKDDPTQGAPSPRLQRLEKVGQYLRDQDLTQPPDQGDNPWLQFLNASTFHKDSRVLYPSMQGKSLLQRKVMLDTAVENAVLAPASVIGASMTCTYCSDLFSVKDCGDSTGQVPPKVVQFPDEESGWIWSVFVQDYFPSQFLYLLRYKVQGHTSPSHVEIIKVQVGRLGNPDDSIQGLDRAPGDDHVILDFAVFTSNTLTLLLGEVKDDEVCLLTQLPLSVLPDASFTQTPLANLEYASYLPAHDIGSLLPLSGINYQTNTQGLAIAVGGVRTTAALLLKSQRRVRLFLLEDGEGDEEEEEDDESRADVTNEVTADVTTDVTMATSTQEEGGEDKENIADLLYTIE